MLDGQAVYMMHELLPILRCIQTSLRNVLPDRKITINGVDIPLFLIGDSAYPLHTWLMKPFTQSATLTQQQQYCNYRLCRARIVVENAYGRLKARWRRLMKRNDMHIEMIPTVISAACILHNMCEVHGEMLQEWWLRDIQASNNDLPQPSSTTHHWKSNRKES